MAFVVINRANMPELASMDADKIAALMLQRAPRPDDLIVEIIDPTAQAEPLAPSKPPAPPMSPPKPIKRVLRTPHPRGKS